MRLKKQQQDEIADAIKAEKPEKKREKKLKAKTE